jgi:hypothetical protein
MVFHLLHKHDIAKKSESEENLLKLRDVTGSKILQQRPLSFSNRSSEEWCTRQIVQDGLSLRQVSSSEFQAAACSAMRLKHFKSHTTVGKIVLEFIEQMKEKTRKELAEKLKAGERFSVIADEWTSIRNRRYLNVCVKSSSYTANLGLVRGKGTITSNVVTEMVQVSVRNSCHFLMKSFSRFYNEKICVFRCYLLKDSMLFFSQYSSPSFFERTAIFRFQSKNTHTHPRTPQHKLYFCHARNEVF